MRYYYREYTATDGGFNYVTFRIIFKVGNVDPRDRPTEQHVSYNYNQTWKDQLDDYTIDETTSDIDYDNSGNPINITNFTYKDTTYHHAELSWEGRQLTSIKVYNSSGTSNLIAHICYTYNDQGLRIQKIIDDQSGKTKHDYKLSGDLLILEIVSEYNNSTSQYDELHKLVYNYDYDGSPIGITLIKNGLTTDYLYIKNLLGDITHVVDLDGNIVVEYTYDAYGSIRSIEGSLASTLGEYNSIRYRSYLYDNETDYYYLQSRHYNPQIARFINADGLLGKVGDLQTHNMYAYCANNPVMYSDITGEFVITLSIILTAAAVGAAVGGSIGLGISIYNDLNDDGYFNLSNGLNEYLAYALGGAIAGVGIGIAGAFGAAAGTATLVGSSATLFTSSGISITFGTALIFGSGVSFLTGISGYSVRTLLNPNENFSTENMFYEGVFNAASGTLSVFGGYLVGITGLRADYVTKLLSRKSDVFLRPMVSNYFTIGIKATLEYLESIYKY